MKGDYDRNGERLGITAEGYVIYIFAWIVVALVILFA